MLRTVAAAILFVGDGMPTPTRGSPHAEENLATAWLLCPSFLFQSHSFLLPLFQKQAGLFALRFL